MTLTLIKNHNGKIWCDYCKTRWGATSLKGQTPAIWTVVSETPKARGTKRHYCRECANMVQHWACDCLTPETCGNHWSIGDQIRYAKAQEELELNV
jgi:hypothetical protein